MVEANGSEVARLLRQIDLEYEVAQRGLSSFAEGSTQHRFLTRKTENIARLTQQLVELEGPEGARARFLGEAEQP